MNRELYKIYDLLNGISKSQEKSNLLINNEIEKLKIIIEKIDSREKSDINIVTALKESNKIVKSLIMYEWIINEKLQIIDGLINNVK